MRWRLQPGHDIDAATGHEGDSVVAQIPARGLGRVTRVRVLRQQADERAVEMKVERGENERKRRLGHARGRRQRVRERAEPLAFGELACEHVEDGRVHDDGRDLRPAGSV